MDKQSAWDARPVRRAYSYIGFCYTVLSVVAILVQLAMVWIPYLIAGRNAFLLYSAEWDWACMTLPFYAAAMPLCYLMMRRLPAHPPQKRPFSAAEIFTLIPICIFAIYAGNILGTVLSMWLSNGTAQNEVAELAMDTHPLKTVAMVIAAPIFEEWICRKVLLDRTRRHGALLSALMSGIIFGLLHQNFFQFFYAFALGLIFSWIYLRCGRLIVPILFHMGVNFLGAVVSPALSALINLEALDQYASADILLTYFPGFLPALLYSLTMIVLAIVGAVLLICHRRKITWEDSEETPPLKQTLFPALCNIGMIVYILFCAALFVVSLFTA